MTSDQAMAGLGAIVGGGGLSAVMVALLGFVTEARKGRKPSAGELSFTVTAGLNQDPWGEIQAGHLGAIVYALTRLAAVREIEAEEGFAGRDFGDRLEGKTMRLMTESARHAVSRS